MKKKTKRKTIGVMTNSRGDWGAIKPVTRVKPSKKVYNRKKNKQEGNW